MGQGSGLDDPVMANPLLDAWRSQQPENPLLAAFQAEQAKREEARQSERNMSIADMAAAAATGPLGILAEAGKRYVRGRAESGEAEADYQRDDGFLDRAGSLLERGTQSAMGGANRVAGAVTGNVAVTNRARALEGASNADIAGTTNWEDVKNADGIGSMIVKGAKFGLETAIQSLPEMLITATPGVGLATETAIQAGRIGQQRAQSNNQTDATIGDVVKAAPFAAASTFLEKLGIGGVTGKFGASAVGRVAAGTVTEAGTEFLQSVIENAGGTAFTERGFDVREAAEQGIAGAIGGAVMGGAISATHEGASQAYHRITNRPIPAGVVETGTAEGATITQDDVDSPLPTELIAKGKAAIAGGDAASQANEILSRAGMPATSTPVEVTLPGGRTLRGTVSDAFQTDAGEFGQSSGIKIALEDGTTFAEHFDDIADAGVTIRPVNQTVEEINAEIKARADQAEAEAQQAMAAYQASAETEADILPPSKSPEAEIDDRTPIVSQPVDQAIADFKARARSAESGGNDNARNPRSSAAGRYQFTDGTWKATYKAEFGATGESDAQILAKKNDAGLQERLMDRLTRDNARELERIGVPINSATLYTAHFAGIGGAKKLYTADKDEAVENVLGAAVVEANPFLRGMTVGQAINDLARRIGSKAPATPGGAGETPSPTPQDEGPNPYEKALADYQREMEASAAREAAKQPASSEMLAPLTPEATSETEDVTPGAAPALSSPRDVAEAGGARPVDGGQPAESSMQRLIARRKAYQAVLGEPIDREWRKFSAESGTVGIPRDEMPQIKAEDRSSMVQFLKARGIDYAEESVPAASLKPTQAEFSEGKVQQAKNYGGGNRAILVSSDGHVLDGHHQWMAALEKGEDIRAIRLDAPIRDLINTVRDMPSVETAKGEDVPAVKPGQAVQPDMLGGPDMTEAQIAARDSIERVIAAAERDDDITDLKAAYEQLRDALARMKKDRAPLSEIASYVDDSDAVGWELMAATRANPAIVEALGAKINAADRPAAERHPGLVIKSLQTGKETEIQPAGTVRGEPQATAATPSTPAVRDLGRDDNRYAVETGAVLTTASGRKMAPAPRWDDSTPLKLKGSLKRQADWLLDEARKEAAAAPKGSDAYYRASTLANMNTSTMAPVDWQMLNEALFGDPYGPKTQAPAKPRDRSVAIIMDPAKGTVKTVPLGKAEQVQTTLGGREDDTYTAKDVGGLTQGLRDSIAKADKDPKTQETILDAIDRGLIRDGDMLVMGNPRWALERGFADIGPVDGTRRGRITEAGKARLAELRNDGQHDDLQDDPEMAAYERKAEAAATPATPATPKKPAVSPNRLVTEDRAEELRARLKEKLNLNRLNSGIDPEIFAIGAELGVYHIEKGARRFTAWAKAVANDLGTDVAALRQYLRGWYNGARDMMEDAGHSVVGMDTPEEVSAAMRSIDTWATEQATNDAGSAMENADDLQRADNLAPDQAGDAREGPGDVQGADGERGAGTGDLGAREGSSGQLRDGDRPGDEPGADVEGKPQPGRPADDAGAKSGGKGRTGSGSRVRGTGKPAGRDGGLDYSAPKGSLTREGGWRATAERNLDIIELVNRLDAEGRAATPEEQALLAKFTGWGAGEIRNNLFRNTRRGADGQREIVPHYAGDWKEISERAAKLLKGEDLETALQSTQYAHYTSEPVIRSIWDGLDRLGFKGGKILEPGMGIGLFAVAAPPSAMANSSYTGIELDKFTAKVAGYLLPQENAIAGDFVKQKLPNGFFDAAIGNPPFSATKVMDDPAYRKFRLSLHDYFFAKSIDKIRPGGLMVFVTSRYTMDKLKDQGRAYIADRADLLGAIRLPQTAFKDNAGTEVVTDVLFFQKRAPGAAPGGEQWLGVEQVKAGDERVMVNEYFARHPEMVLGRHATTGSMYRANEYTVEPLDGDIAEHFAKAVQNLPQDVYFEAVERAVADVKAKTFERDFAPASEKEGGLYLKDGEIFVREQGSGVPLSSIEKINDRERAWLTDYTGLRDAVKEAQRDQLQGGDWEKSLKQLNKLYDAFVAKHGPIGAFTESETVDVDEDGNEKTRITRRFKNKKVLSLDIESPLVQSLEKITDDGQIIKGPFLKGRTLNKPGRPKIESVQDALAVGLDEIGRLDLDYIAKLANKPRDEVIEALGDGIYMTPDGDWQTSDEYLSGDVVAKLEEARTAADVDTRFERNVKALQEVQPRRLGHAEINVKLGAGWIPENIVQQFMGEELGIETAISYEPATAEWAMDKTGTRSRYARSRGATSDFGTQDRTPAEILLSVLNNQPIKVTRTDSGPPKRTYTDEKATAAAVEKAKELGERFKTWVWEDKKRASELVELYNRKFNNLAPRRFSGEHLTLPGLSSNYSLYPHQKRAIWRVIQTGNTYLNHAVGAGKTLEMIVSGMEMRRLGLVKKPMYAVPNHMLNQFAREFLEAYPAANIMVADEKSFHTDNRKRFMAQAALNDPDAIVITHSSFGKIATKPESRKAIVAAMIAELEAALDGAEARHTRSKIEKQIEAIQRRFEGKTDDSKKDQALTFEEMGVDFLFIDEAHEFRKLDYATNRAVKGIDPNGSQRALDLYIKTRWLNQQNPGRSLVLASGTPVTNTMAELYTVMRYMDEAALEADGLRAFDAWANMFGEVATSYEQNAAGGYEPVERFANFVNIPELMKRVRTFMDVLTSDQLGDLVKRPKINGGVPHNVVSPPIESLEDYMKGELSERIEKSRNWKPSREQPNNPDPIIAINGDARLSSIDMRFIDPTLPNDPGSKLNVMIDKIIDTHNRIKDIVYTDPKTGKKELTKGGTQIVFSAVGFGEGAMKNRGFDLRGWVDRRLIDAGLKKSEIAWMSDADSHAKKEALFKDMRAGKVKVLIGSPKNMGTGVNVQNRLKALHFLSPPWYPSDVEQPHGRIIRQGNWNEDVDLYWYATKGTYDSTAWGMVSRKARFIEQAMKGDDTVRKLEDISEANQYEMAAALAAGDERVIQVAGLSADITRLERLAGAHKDEQRSLAAEKRNIEKYGIPSAEREIAALEAAIKARDPDAPFSLAVGPATYEKQNEAGDALFKAIDDEWTRWQENIANVRSHRIATFQGEHPVLLEPAHRGAGFELVLEMGGQKLTVLSGENPASLSPTGLSQRLANIGPRLSSDLRDQQRKLADYSKQLENIERKLGTPFPQEGELAEKIAERAQLQADMAAETAAAEAAKKGKQDEVTRESRNLLVEAPPLLAEIEDERLNIAWDRLAERLDKMNVDERVRLSVQSWIDLRGRVAGQFGTIGNGEAVIRIAMNNGAQTPEMTLDHEVVHALKWLGNFKDSEWTRLSKDALADTEMMASIRRRYPDYDEASQIEEAIADRYMKWRAGQEEKGFVRAAFERISEFFRALGQLLRGEGFTTSEAVFRAIGRGDVGLRQGNEEGAEAKRYSIPADPTFDNTETERRFQEARQGVATTRTLREAIGERLVEGWHGITRHWINLPNEPRFAGLQQKLRAIEAAPQVAKERTVRLLEDMVDGFDAKDLELFTRKVILDDLSWEASQERDLPFGFTPDTVRSELAKVDAILQADPDKKVWKAVMKRKVANRRVAQELVNAGVLEAEQIKNPAYYRHQVLEYAKAQQKFAASAGKRLKTPRWAKRMGSTMDINANLLEAEFDWLNKAFMDIPVAKSIEWIKNSPHNILRSLKDEARRQNRAAMDKVIEDAEEVLSDPQSTMEELGRAENLVRAWKGANQRIGMGFAGLKSVLQSGVLNIPRSLQRAADSVVNGPGSGEPPFALLNWILDNNLDGSIEAATIYKGIGLRRSIMQTVLGRNYIDPSNAEELTKRLAPEGYTTWQPDEGKLLFTVKTLPEHVIDGMLQKINGLAPEGVDASAFAAELSKARTMMAMGGDRYTMILPEEVAATLNQLRHPHHGPLFEFLVETPVALWKRWVLINPRRWLKYNLNNQVGDLDAVLAGNPRILKRVPEAAKELYRVMRGQAKPSDRYEEAIERGVFDSGISIQEIPDINAFASFERFATDSKKPTKLAMSVLRKAWAALQGSTQWRENVFRYAAYLDYADRLDAGEAQASIGYGASLPDMVDAVSDKRDRAALLARDLIGDYGAISHFGTGIRRTVIPFWSWMEINTKRYKRLTANAYSQGVGKGLKVGTGLALAAGTRTTARLAVQAMLIYGVIQLWNSLFFPDEEDDLDDMQQAQLHIILGRNQDGEVISLRTQGALSDALSWFGFQQTAEAYKEYERGRGSLAEVLSQPAKTTINKIATSVSPVISVPVESAMGKKLWPDVFNPRPNRDPWRNVASTLSLENEYDALADKPSRGYARSWADAVFYRRDPGEIAYNAARSITFNWLQRTKGQEGSSSYTTPRSRATYDYKKAMTYGDDEAAQKALEEMAGYGMTVKDLDASIKRASPLGPIPKKDRKAFVEGLSDQERKTMIRGIEWYQQTFGVPYE